MADLESNGFRTCKQCLTSKSLDVFRKVGKNKRSYHNLCRQCEALNAKEYRINNPEKAKAAKRKWNQNNPQAVRRYVNNWTKKYPEKRKAIQRKYTEANRESERLRLQVYTESNREAVYARNRAWEIANPGKVTAKAGRRRAQKRNATPLWADMKKIAAIYEEAARLTRETGIKHDVDHILPLKNKYICGLHVENNLQVLTHEENMKKHNKFKPG